MSDVRYVHQHFDRPARFGWFTPYEWTLCAVAALVTTAWWRYLSPFGFSTTATVAILLNTPLYLSARLGDGRGGRKLRVRLRVAVAWWARPERGRGGRSQRARGYAVVFPTPRSPRPPQPTKPRESPDFERLWG